MTAQELTRFQLDDAGFQLAKALEPISDHHWGVKPAAATMTPAEMVEHLCEAYEAFMASSKGEKWSWGSYTLPDTSKAASMRVFLETRGRAVELALEASDDERLKNAHMFLTAHDAYHVGQLCAANLEWNPDWDPYSIYNH